MKGTGEKKGLSAEWAVAEVDHLFSKLGRYTRFVVFSKWFLSVVALGLVTTLIALPLVSKDRSGMRVSFIDTAVVSAKNAARPVMSSPEYRGTDAKGQQYQIKGIRASQATQTLVVIDQVEAQLVTEAGGWRSLTATKADYDQESKIIDLVGSVTLTDDQGYSFLTEEATVDTQAATVRGDQRVTGTGPLGKLLASGFEIKDNGSHIVFYGGAERVKLHIERAKQQ